MCVLDVLCDVRHVCVLGAVFACHEKKSHMDQKGNSLHDRNFQEMLTFFNLDMKCSYSSAPLSWHACFAKDFVIRTTKNSKVLSSKNFAPQACSGWFLVVLCGPEWLLFWTVDFAHLQWRRRHRGPAVVTMEKFCGQRLLCGRNQKKVTSPTERAETRSHSRGDEFGESQLCRTTE